MKTYVEIKNSLYIWLKSGQLDTNGIDKAEKVELSMDELMKLISHGTIIERSVNQEAREQIIKFLHENPLTNETKDAAVKLADVVAIMRKFLSILETKD